MGGSLWRQAIGSDEAVELTHPRAAYDYQPDVAPDGGSVVFSRYDGDAIELWRLDLKSGREQPLTSGKAVNVEPRLSPDGKRIAWVSTAGTGHFNLFVADIGPAGLRNARPLLGERQSKIARYYYSAYDHALNPSWTPDGKRILYVSNAEVAWGTGDIWSVAVDDPRDRRKVLSEETSWSARPETSPDGKLVLFASYHGRQWRQYWVTTPGGAAPLPLTFGEFDRSNARWSPDGERIALISNQQGNTSLIVHDFVGGAETPVVATRRRYKEPQARLTLDIRDERGRSVPARVAVLGSDGRAAAPACVLDARRRRLRPRTPVERNTLFPLPVALHDLRSWRRHIDLGAAWFRLLAVAEVGEACRGHRSNRHGAVAAERRYPRRSASSAAPICTST